VSGNKFLLDTNAIIALQREDAALIALLNTATNVFIPIFAVGELYFGVHKSTRVEENRKRLASFLADRVILHADLTSADVYGLIRQQLRGKGRPIPENDIWIAALAIQHDLTLMTSDAHFSEVDALDTRDW
jgi:tRNA(fMet)-specific endonuclease VapC